MIRLQQIVSGVHIVSDIVLIVSNSDDRAFLSWVRRDDVAAALVLVENRHKRTALLFINVFTAENGHDL